MTLREVIRYIDGLWTHRGCRAYEAARGDATAAQEVEKIEAEIALLEGMETGIVIQVDRGTDETYIGRS